MMGVVFEKLIGLVMVPLVIVGISIELVGSDNWIRRETAKLHRNDDSLELELIEKTNLAVAGLRASRGQITLAELNVKSRHSEVLFSNRELSHLKDVVGIFRVHDRLLAAGLMALFVYGVFRELLPVLVVGAVEMLILAVLVGLIVMFFWEQLFISFHQVLFSQGNWQFPIGSLLIQLYPEQFWVDAASSIVAICLTTALIVICLWFWRRRTRSL